MNNTCFKTSPYYTIKKYQEGNLLVAGPDEDRLLTEPLQNTVLELLIDNHLQPQDFVMNSAFPEGTHPLFVVKYIQAFKQKGLVLLGNSEDDLEFPVLDVTPFSTSHNTLSKSYHVVELDTSDFQEVWETYTAQQTPNHESLTIVVTQDFLDERIKQINEDMISKKQPYILFKPFGKQIMVSPILNGKAGICWESLSQRIGLHRPLIQMDGFETLQKATPFYTKESMEIAIQFLVDTLETAVDLQDYKQYRGKRTF